MNDGTNGFAPSVAINSGSATDCDNSGPPPIPDYLRETYWWAYLHPNAIRVFEREWLVNLILWGNMRRLTASVLDEIDGPRADPVLQLACVYGRFSERLARHLARAGARLHLLDIAAVQLDNARRKLGPFENIRYHRQDASALTFPAASFGTSVLFFLLHEQPEDVRRRTLREALRVTRPGGKLVIVDYHGPSRWSPCRYLMRPVLHWLEPFALDLWRHPLQAFLPRTVEPSSVSTSFYFGGLYQKTVIRLPV